MDNGKVAKFKSYPRKIPAPGRSFSFSSHIQPKQHSLGDQFIHIHTKVDAIVECDYTFFNIAHTYKYRVLVNSLSYDHHRSRLGTSSNVGDSIAGINQLVEGLLRTAEVNSRSIVDAQEILLAVVRCAEESNRLD